MGILINPIDRNRKLLPVFSGQTNIYALERKLLSSTKWYSKDNHLNRKPLIEYDTQKNSSKLLHFRDDQKNTQHKSLPFYIVVHPIPSIKCEKNDRK